MNANIDPDRGGDPPLSGWAAGGIAFAACMLLLIGSFQIIAGLAAIFEDEFFVVGREYAFDLDVSAWGWVHLILGLLLVFTGIGLFSGKAWAAVTAIRSRTMTPQSASTSAQATHTGTAATASTSACPRSPASGR